MMAKNNYIKLFTDALESWEPLSDAECGRLVRALLKYKRFGQTPELNGNERILFPAFRAQIDRESAHYNSTCQKNRENISKRWNTNEYDRIPCDTKNTKTKNKEKEKEKDEEKEIILSADKPQKSQKRFVPPTLEEIALYCQERKNQVDPKRFFSHYEANGWYVGKNKMKNWKAAVMKWESNNFDWAPQQKRGENPFLREDI